MMFSVAGITASAATVTQDGLNVSLTTDKTEYKKDEAITATLTVENTGSASVKDVKLENIVPEGYELAKDYSLTKSVDELKSNDKAELKVVYNAKTGSNVTPSNNNTTPTNTVTPTNTATTASSANLSTDTVQTGDTAVAVVIIAVIVVSLGLGFLAVRKKKGRSLLSVALTVSILGTAMAVVSVETNAAGISKTIEVTEKIKADNNDKVIKAKVTYTTTIDVDKPDNSDITKIQDGKFVDNNNLFEVTDEQLEKLDSVSQLIVNRVSYKLSNKKQNGNKGTADIIVYSPNLKTAFNEAIDKSEKTMNIEDSDIIDKTKSLLLDNIEKAELLEYKFEVDLEKKDNNWVIVMTEPLANALTGNIEEVFFDTYGYSEE